ncbi:unnamed protein product [Protopolystoma xenopodis]|uniref:Uncharacterized protein n=1 Tax=Protopolystoma xenopodis TaxID=117903 RepID=A0A448WMP6_9PLAT|nr:unnamed protein product [Protopolystoma xenopodis]
MPTHSYPQPRPYGLLAVLDLMTYLASHLVPRGGNFSGSGPGDAMVSIALNLLTIALETGADAIPSSPELLGLVRADMTKHLMLVRNLSDEAAH